ncbi:glycosyltransferase family 4 protein [Haloferula sp. BvORR071]|uniref:glycosyltransferase family 4 protein n=1 Tax=Haloferula sp. BvORR071 TaxID=1396141 RepID=UPI0009462A1C|nr:glycosyltransferase family 4 protein [Haloferula sp. BvORR071]
MRVALVSFEFPPAVAIGGIGTYAWQASLMMSAAGWDVEVFAAGDPKQEEAATAHGIKVHRFQAANRDEFRNLIVDSFRQRQRVKPFDVLESPEIGAEGAGIAEAFPQLPLVVKLHTPSYLVAETGYEPLSLAQRTRFSLGALARGRWATLKAPAYVPELDMECRFTRSADEVAAPSHSIGDRLIQAWSLDPARVSFFPLPVAPEPALLELPFPDRVGVIGFLGRLEARKGVPELAEAIPAILKEAPHLRFRFIGPSWPYKGTDMESWIRKVCHRHLGQIEFTGPVKRTDLHAELGRCDAVVLPSRWESFGLVCPEAMAAGRTVIGSASGGMADIIEAGKSGLLVPPRDPAAISRAILKLAADPALARSLAIGGRARILELLSPAQVLSRQEASYRRAIAHSKLRSSRRQESHAAAI